MHVIDSKEKELDVLKKTLDEYKELGLEDVVILTQGSLEYSSLDGHLVESTKEDPYDYFRHNGKKYRVATCITFKGLEADAIILLNLNQKSFEGERGKEFYVGTSRAKCKLDMICTLSDDDYLSVVSAIDKGAASGAKSKNAMKKIFGNLFSSEVVAE